MKQQVIIDLTEEIAEYTGGLEEKIWRNAPEFQEFGNPEELAFSAISTYCDYQCDPAGLEECLGGDPTHRFEYVFRSQPGLVHNCWDLYFHDCAHRIGKHVLPILRGLPGTYIDSFDFRNNALVVTISDDIKSKPAYLSYEDPPRD